MKKCLIIALFGFVPYCLFGQLIPPEYKAKTKTNPVEEINANVVEQHF